MRPNPVLAGCTLIFALLAGCSSGPSAAPAASTAPAQSASATVAAPSDPGTVAPSSDLVPDGVTLTMPEGWRDTSTSTFRHFLPPNVASDPLAERWGDILVYEPTAVIDPTSGKQQPLPDDPAAWLRANPSLKVLDERTVEVDDRSAALIDVGWPTGGNAFFGGEAHESFEGIHERFILVPVGQRWIVVQASTFRGPEGLAEPDGGADALSSVLDSFDIAES